MGYFVEVLISEDKCVGVEACGVCVKVCPVSIFEDQGGMTVIVAKNEDECIMCDQCLDKCEPGAITINKKY
ncbi:MAG: ferredoxin [Proteobacteria bacterium]|nr:ferredoxin [Pseudomonadota bacterium]